MSYSDMYFDNASGNEFLSVLYELYEAVNFPKDEYFEEEKQTGYKYLGRFPNGIRIKTKGETIKINKKVEKIMNTVDMKIESLYNTAPDFNRLFDFATLIRSMETVFFYKNDANAEISCDHEIGQERKRTLYFNKELFTIRLSMERDYDATKNVLKINVYRNYGKKLCNEFIVKNRDTAYDNADDIYLINEVNKIIQKEMGDFFKKCAYGIKNNNLKYNPSN